MNRLSTLIVVGLIACVASTALAASPATQPTTEPEQKKVELKTFDDKVNYTIGLQIGGFLKQVKVKLNLAVIYQAINDALKDNKPLLDKREMLEVQKKYGQLVEEKMRSAVNKNSLMGKKFLAENKKKEGVVTTVSGLQYKVLKQGTGDKPSASSTIEVHYRGTLIDGTEFDSSYKRNEPAKFGVSGVIKGFGEGLQLMSVGSKYQLFIPSELAYGPQGPPGIGPNQTLIFEVELLKVIPKE